MFQDDKIRKLFEETEETEFPGNFRGNFRKPMLDNEMNLLNIPTKTLGNFLKEHSGFLSPPLWG